MTSDRGDEILVIQFYSTPKQNVTLTSFVIHSDQSLTDDFRTNSFQVVFQV